jgi:hypothetical protein
VEYSDLPNPPTVVVAAIKEFVQSVQAICAIKVTLQLRINGARGRRKH